MLIWLGLGLLLRYERYGPAGQEPYASSPRCPYPLPEPQASLASSAAIAGGAIGTTGMTDASKPAKNCRAAAMVVTTGQVWLDRGLRDSERFGVFVSALSVDILVAQKIETPKRIAILIPLFIESLMLCQMTMLDITSYPIKPSI